ncbi:MAG: DsbA family oxidoreductase [Bacteroidales bacterium]|nr:DsbA family oxidoreductase [Bacteroidales bacterium]
MEIPTNQLTVEIWSDIMCPFCYLGKRKFENALDNFTGKESVSVIWKSFQLQPDLKTDTSIDIHTYLCKIKGIGIGQAKQINEHLGKSGRSVGLEYNFDKIIVANTLKAHILLHFAREQGKQNEVKEKLLKAYFTDGRNVDDIPTLIDIGNNAGLNSDGLSEALQDDNYIDAVREDIYEAQQLGIRGVPYFVFDKKYGVSGAQEPALFSEILEKSFNGWKKNNPVLTPEPGNGQSCTPDQICD